MILTAVMDIHIYIYIYEYIYICIYIYTYTFFLRKEYDCRSHSVCQLGQTKEFLLVDAMSKASVAKEPLTTVGNLM